jgi:hypothetical protein
MEESVALPGRSLILAGWRVEDMVSIFVKNANRKLLVIFYKRFYLL